jgi:osmotically-inducible protein OsmY
MSRFLTQAVALATSMATVAATLSACGGARPAGPPTATASASPALVSAPPMVVAAPREPTLKVTDTTLARALANAIGGDAVLAQQHIHVAVDHDLVTLTGSVNSVTAKARAERLVRGFRGPTEMNDQLVVDAPPRPDADIARDVRQVLDFDKATRKAKVQVEVDDGLVTLRGSNASRHERQLLVASASGVKGVKDVMLAFASPDAPAVEERVAREVNQRLADDGRLEGARVTTHVQGRSVQLSGTVGSLAQREAAVEDARVDGVDEVQALSLQVDWSAATQARAGLPYSAPADSDLAAAVLRELGGDPRIGFPLPMVTATRGVVTLSGKVSDCRSRRAATNDADSVRGVLRVDVQMTVAPARRESDATIQQLVERTLLDDVETPDASHLQMTTSGAKVTLRGNVVSQEEKLLIASDVEGIPGVIGVEDDLHVQGAGAAADPPPPGALRTRVVEQMFWDARVDSSRVLTAVTPDGGVTLSGEVFSPQEERAAVADALGAGAFHVVDHLRIAGGS